MTTIIKHHSLGDITVSQTWRARRISLSVRPPGHIRLSIPYHVPLSEGIRFVDSKQDWVRKAVEKYALRRQNNIILMPYNTREHRLSLDPCGKDKITVRVANGVILVTYPDGLDISDDKLQDAIKKGLEEAWRIEAKAYLPERLRHLADIFRLKYRSVTIRNTVSKWGSCSSNDDISLSLHLMRLPDHLIDYVLVHELCHTIHKNHGEKFHALLDEYCGGRHKALRKELKEYSTRW